jgi:hypothetical protein
MNPDGSKRFKARVVIKGYEQSDYGETYVPVAKLVSFRGDDSPNSRPRVGARSNGRGHCIPQFPGRG